MDRAKASLALFKLLGLHSLWVLEKGFIKRKHNACINKEINK
jgi:hypothetical protein